MVLAVKPQVMQPVARALAEAIRPTQTVVSVAAGIEGPALSRWLTSRLGTPGIIRAMPNTPALLGAGATGLVAVNAVSEMGRSTTESIFAAVGTVEWLEREADLNAVIAVAGSAPAYFFAFIEALTRGGTDLGLPQAMAERGHTDCAGRSPHGIRDGCTRPDLTRARHLTRRHHRRSTQSTAGRRSGCAGSQGHAGSRGPGWCHGR